MPQVSVRPGLILLQVNLDISSLSSLGLSLDEPVKQHDFSVAGSCAIMLHDDGKTIEKTWVSSDMVWARKVQEEFAALDGVLLEEDPYQREVDIPTVDEEGSGMPLFSVLSCAAGSAEAFFDVSVFLRGRPNASGKSLETIQQYEVPLRVCIPLLIRSDSTSDEIRPGVFNIRVPIPPPRAFSRAVDPASFSAPASENECLSWL